MIVRKDFNLKSRALVDFKNYRAQALQANGDGVQQGGAKEFPDKMLRDIYDLRIELHRQRIAFEKDQTAQLAHASHEVNFGPKKSVNFLLDDVEL